MPTTFSQCDRFYSEKRSWEVGGRQKGGSPGENGREAGSGGGDRKRDSRGGGNREKLRKILQHFEEFCNRNGKKSRGNHYGKGREPGVRDGPLEK